MRSTVPPPLMTNEPGSFAQQTILMRKPQIIRQVIADNDYPADVLATLDALREEIATGRVAELREDTADRADWEHALGPWQGHTWLELPWFLAEAYFYRRLLDAVRFFQSGHLQGRDPFAAAKQAQTAAAIAALPAPAERLEQLLARALWGNRADLSNATVSRQLQSRLPVDDEREHLLIDHRPEAVACLVSGMRRIDYVCDNVGFELLNDLWLVDHLLVSGAAGLVVLHLKRTPFFVSDVTVADVGDSLVRMRAAGGPAGELARRLDGWLADGRLAVRDEAFWTTGRMLRQMPPELRAELEQADLVIFKGDANYRRLVDDARWPATARLEEIVEYFPAPLLALRTLKAELVVGLAPGQAERLQAQEPDWLISGRWGLIHFVPRPAGQEKDT